MADEQRDESKSEASAMMGWLRRGAWMVVLALVLAFIVWRMIPGVIKLFLIAVGIGAVVYFVKVGREDPTHDKGNSKG
ncbi:hypothetical protein PPSIR1_36187 [Plesiocystis pacifica SIR-1]|uniref:Uncharacterized protein n=1 Tax=Plesiocystis pacifica SIR-1 TaxID=391625 RepID=A6G1E2_9BACT|nr:hypothetical protein [Plesiocystis pacifica]EDM80206.1 hypothetical protein PPSIR1_36187 [Plesiocystis pacifica SIR-1]